MFQCQNLFLNFALAFLAGLFIILKILLGFAKEIVTVYIPLLITSFAVTISDIHRIWTVSGRNSAKELNLAKDFEKLADDITLSPVLTNQMEKAAQIVFQHLKQNCRKHGLTIGHTLIAGSVAKNTAIMFQSSRGMVHKSDLDLLVFLKNWSKPVGRPVHKLFKSLLEELPDVYVKKAKKFSLRFYMATAQGRVKIDLIVTNCHLWNVSDRPNFIHAQAGIAREILTGKRLKALHKTGSIDTTESRLHSYSCANLVVQLIRSYTNDPLICSLIKLAKYWTRRLEIPRGNRLPKSCMIEIICIAIQTRITNTKQNSCLFFNFKSFLHEISRLDTLKVSLASSIKNESCRTYTTPMVTDPINNFNNFAARLDPEVVHILMDQANKTLAIISALEKYKDYRVGNAIDVIFSHKYSQGDSRQYSNLNITYLKSLSRIFSY